jgi:hypothetical protein
VGSQVDAISLEKAKPADVEWRLRWRILAGILQTKYAKKKRNARTQNQNANPKHGTKTQ